MAITITYHLCYMAGNLTTGRVKSPWTLLSLQFADIFRSHFCSLSWLLTAASCVNLLLVSCAHNMPILGCLRKVGFMLPTFLDGWWGILTGHSAKQNHDSLVALSHQGSVLRFLQSIKKQWFGVQGNTFICTVSLHIQRSSKTVQLSCAHKHTLSDIFLC